MSAEPGALQPETSPSIRPAQTLHEVIANATPGALPDVTFRRPPESHLDRESQSVSETVEIDPPRSNRPRARGCDLG
jgi:hypothetical protein